VEKVSTCYLRHARFGHPTGDLGFRYFYY